MKTTILLVGKTREHYLISGVEEYLKRLKHYTPLTVDVIPDPKYSKKAGIDQVKKLEGEQILKRLQSADHVILMDEGGEMMDSLDFARYLADLERKTSKVTFVIGGPFGFSPEVYQRANAQLSLSRLTFSHQMVRLIFVEQLYRAYTIIRGEPYHHK